MTAAEAAAAFAALADPALVRFLESCPGRWVRDPHLDDVWGYRESRHTGTKRVSVVLYLAGGEGGGDFELDADFEDRWAAAT